MKIGTIRSFTNGITITDDDGGTRGRKPVARYAELRR